MSWRPGAKAAIAAMAFLALAIVPLAAADHAYSHRYIVFGRVVDAENDPVPDLTVDLGYEEPFEPEGPCANQPGTETEAFGPTRTSPVTNQFGEFTFCFHTHSMSRGTPGAGILKIESLGVEQRFEFDGFMRYSFVPIKLNTTQSTANTTLLSQFYTVQGRSWRPEGADVRVEGIRVYGDTVKFSPVNITFTYNGNEPMKVNTSTNGYGDFALRIPVTERPTSGTVTIEVANETFTQDITPLGVTQFRAELAEIKDPFVAKALIGLGVAAVVVAGGGALWFATSRVRAARDERLVRETSTRKRANK